MTTHEKLFEQVRNHAAKGQLVITRADGLLMLLPAMARASVNPEMVAAVERIIPPTIKRNVAVIGDTAWASASSARLQAANQAIPFFGMLMAFNCIGHSVWVFDGSANTLSSGCSEADVLIVDSASVSALPSDWQLQAKATMRNPQILIHDRATYSLCTPA